MFEIHNYIGFITAILLFQLVPGPGTVAILNATARSGRLAGMGAVLGTLAGDLVYMVAAVSGLAALLTASPVLFSVVRLAGIAYLCRFGWTLLRSATTSNVQETCSVPSVRRSFHQAFVVGLTNPKVIIFFMSFFPLFMTSSTSSVTLVIMMAHVSLLCLVYQTLLVFVGDQLAKRLTGMEKVRRCTTRLAGAALIVFGIKLALESD
ncbi:membrane protein, LysE superfamily [Geotalea daltonii FRC-32]|uniref:Membrane protein, LysE superfamily n=1 Tax=Geotalea daltonii (strain DSM 22248 / JCM 15807 / FRC-32) TaxID=316067 RepID=B9M076_GEODF|nr:LysE family translocator [Geotalea daltonii]ACM20856.1 membrane protein, LysE superfamily [Geotalea daltonii FRC-32]